MAASDQAQPPEVKRNLKTASLQSLIAPFAIKYFTKTGSSKTWVFL